MLYVLICIQEVLPNICMDEQKTPIVLFHPDSKQQFDVKSVDMYIAQQIITVITFCAGEAVRKL